MVMLRFNAWLVRGYAHVFVLHSGFTVTLPYGQGYAEKGLSSIMAETKFLSRSENSKLGAATEVASCLVWLD